MRRFVLLLVLTGVALVVVPSAAGATRECDGHQVCVPIAGPWVLVPTGSAARRPAVEYQLTCPRGFVVGGLDAELSHRAIDIQFLGTLGSPVNPGISTARSVVFSARWAGRAAIRSSFRPRAGCIPAAGGGPRVPTSAAVFPPGQPIARRVKTVRIRPGITTVVQACRRGERLVGASHALGFDRQSPPSTSLAATVSGAQSVRGSRVVVTIRADAELGGVRAVAQVHALCGVSP